MRCNPCSPSRADGFPLSVVRVPRLTLRSSRTCPQPAAVPLCSLVIPCLPPSFCYRARRLAGYVRRHFMHHNGQLSCGINVPFPFSPRRCSNVPPSHQQTSRCPKLLLRQNTQTSAVAKFAAQAGNPSSSRYRVTGNSNGSRLTCRSSRTLPLLSGSFMLLLSRGNAA